MCLYLRCNFISSRHILNCFHDFILQLYCTCLRLSHIFIFLQHILSCLISSCSYYWTYLKVLHILQFSQHIELFHIFMFIPFGHILDSHSHSCFISSCPYYGAFIYFSILATYWTFGHILDCLIPSYFYNTSWGVHVFILLLREHILDCLVPLNLYIIPWTVSCLQVTILIP